MGHPAGRRSIDWNGGLILSTGLQIVNMVPGKISAECQGPVNR